MHDIGGPYNGLAKKIGFIKDCYLKALQDGRIRQFAEQYAVGENDYDKAKALYAAIREHMSYLHDPVGVEMTKSPSVMMDEMVRRGSTAGDCDDHACLGYALLQSIGIPAKLRVVWYEGSAMPNHIYDVAYLRGQWVPFDTTSRLGFGMEMPNARQRDF